MSRVSVETRMSPWISPEWAEGGYNYATLPSLARRQTQPVIDEREPARAAPGRFRFRSAYLTIPLLLILIALIVLQILPANDYILLPGDALPVTTMIAIPGHPAKHKLGQLFLTDVTLYKADHMLEELWFRLNADADFQPAGAVAGGLSQTQFNQLNIQMMNDSIRQAEAAALSTIPGYHPHLAKTGPRIVFVLPNTPAAAIIRTGDVVLSVDGKRVKRAQDVAPVVHQVRPGSTVSLRLLRNGKPVTLQVRTIHATNSQPAATGRSALIGITLQDQIILPVKIRVNPGAIGGPSAGLMFSLGIVQRLVPQNITHGCNIAGTGTIDYAGTVGPIGGAKQKILAARKAGVRYFLVPNDPSNVVPAREHAGNVTVVPVKTLNQALHFLAGIPPCH